MLDLVAVAGASAVVASSSSSAVRVSSAVVAAVSAASPVAVANEFAVLDEGRQGLAGFRVCPEGSRAVALGVGAVLDVAREEVRHVLHREVGGVDDGAVGGHAVQEAAKRKERVSRVG